MYPESYYETPSTCSYVSSPLGSCGCCLMKNAAVFMLVFCCVKSLATAPESVEGKKKMDRISGGGVCFFFFLSGVEVRGLVVCKKLRNW